MKPTFSATAAAAAQALLVHAMQTDEEKLSKRAAFEDVAYAHYLERGAVENLSREEFCMRSPDDPERYHFHQLNTSWWGFQAGFMHAALIGAKVKK